VPLGGSSPEVKIYDARRPDQPITTWNLESQNFRANGVALRDLTGDRLADLIVTSAPGELPRIIVLDPLSGQKLRDFPGFTPEYLGGLYVA
jgi:hypothetical protein